MNLEAKPTELSEWYENSQSWFKTSLNNPGKGLALSQNSDGQFEVDTFWMWTFYKFLPHPLPCKTIDEAKDFVDDFLKRFEKLESFQ
jgi:hypothetical protein